MAFGTVSDRIYDSSWDGQDTAAPSQGQMYTKIEAMISNDAFGVGWDEVIDVAPSQDAVYEIMSDHRHDGHTLEMDGIDSDGGAFAFDTTGEVTANAQWNFAAGIGNSTSALIFNDDFTGALGKKVTVRGDATRYTEIYHAAGGNSIINSPVGGFNYTSGGIVRLFIGGAGITGKIGVNQTIPADRLHASETTSTFCRMRFTNSTTGDLVTDGVAVGLAADESAVFWQYENNYMSFGTNNTERIRILAGGDTDFLGNGLDNVASIDNGGAAVVFNDDINMNSNNLNNCASIDNGASAVQFDSDISVDRGTKIILNADDVGDNYLVAAGNDIGLYWQGSLLVNFTPVGGVLFNADINLDGQALISTNTATSYIQFYDTDVASTTGPSIKMGKGLSDNWLIISNHDAAGDLTSLDIITTSGGGASADGFGDVLIKPDGVLSAKFGGSGATYLGDGGTTNYFEAKADGEVALHGTARVKLEQTSSAFSQKLGVSSPSSVLRQIGTTATMLEPVLEFSKTVQNDIYFVLHVSEMADSTVDVEFHLMWVPGAAWTAGNYVWKLEYIVKDEDADSTTVASTTISEDVTPANATDFIETEFSTTINADAQQTISCHLYRDVASDNGDDHGDVRFVEYEFTANKLGEAT
jgi:hypothetical protein